MLRWLFKAGSKLPSEPQLRRMLGVSWTGVRERIKVLAGINVLNVFPGHGTFVNENPNIMVNSNALKIALGRETINSLYEARFALDVGIARFVTLKANEEDIEALRKAIHKMERAIELDPIDNKSATEGDEEFHISFCRAAHNKLLENITQPIITHAMVRTWKQIKGSREFRMAAIKGHKEILEGVEKGDVRMVVDAVEKHLRTVFQGIDKQQA
jgi:GntR family transcriptional repressor for pyruvate dehydrogenase complex